MSHPYPYHAMSLPSPQSQSQSQSQTQTPQPQSQSQVQTPHYQQQQQQTPTSVPTTPGVVSFAELPVSETPPDMPGTPTSTTTSLSAISTVAIKDGQRGHFGGASHLLGRGHSHNPSTTSLEAERAERISRLAGLERISTLRAPPSALNNQTSSNAPYHSHSNSANHSSSSGSPFISNANYPSGGGANAGNAGDTSSSYGGAGSVHQSTPTSTGFPGLVNGLAPVYFDAHGQPTARTKMSTVGTASATTASSVSGDTHLDETGSCSTNVGDREGEGEDHEAEAIMGDGDNEAENMSVSARSGGFDDHMSDDGASSLVGFGEGAGSTISGPIYQRRQLATIAAGAGWSSVGSINGDDYGEGPAAAAAAAAAAATGSMNNSGTGRFSSGSGVLHQRVDSSNSLGGLAQQGLAAGPGAGASVAAAAAAATGQAMSHAAVLEWAQQPAATRRFKSSREAAESILRERKQRAEAGQGSGFGTGH